MKRAEQRHTGSADGAPPLGPSNSPLQPQNDPSGSGCCLWCGGQTSAHHTGFARSGVIQRRLGGFPLAPARYWPSPPASTPPCRRSRLTLRRWTVQPRFCLKSAGSAESDGALRKVQTIGIRSMLASVRLKLPWNRAHTASEPCCTATRCVGSQNIDAFRPNGSEKPSPKLQHKLRKKLGSTAQTFGFSP